MRTMEILTICEIASRVLTAIVGALAKRGCNSTWSTSFERPLSSLSTAAGLVS